MLWVLEEKSSENSKKQALSCKDAFLKILVEIHKIGTKQKQTNTGNMSWEKLIHHCFSVIISEVSYCDFLPAVSWIYFCIKTDSFVRSSNCESVKDGTAQSTFNSANI